MAGKTKVNLEFAVSDNTKQTVSFEVPNGADGVGIKTVTVTPSQVPDGKDDDAGTGDTLKGNFRWWNPPVTAGNKSFAKKDKDLLLVVSINGITQPPTVWQDAGTTLVFAEDLQAGDVLNVLYLEGGK